MEHGSFSSLVFSPYGGNCREAERFLTKLALKLSETERMEYSIVIHWLRAKLSFNLRKIGQLIWANQMPESTIRNTYLPNKRKIPATTHLKSLFGWRLLVALGFLLLWMSFYDVKCCCFVLVSCLGYHVRKMYDRNWWNFVLEKNHKPTSIHMQYM